MLAIMDFVHQVPVVSVVDRYHKYQRYHCAGLRKEKNGC